MRSSTGRSRRGRAVLLGILTAATVLSAPAANATPETPSLSWQPCPDGLPAPLECATLAVPLDYRAPDGPKLTVAVSRKKATNPATRRGILLLNPGGPGGPGLSLPLTIGQLAPQSVTDSYDLIGFDPRGTGHSTPQTCELTPEQQNPGKIIPYPSPDGNIDGNVTFARQVAQQCAAHSGAVLPYITTANTARDMDGIRAALGEPKLSYFGISYGSYLGAVYTTLFPAQSDRIILDSVVDPRNVWRSVWQHWGESTEVRFGDFAKWAAERNPTYELGATPEAVRATYFTLAAKLDADPMQLPGLLLDGNVFRAQTRGALYSDQNFDALAKAWQAVQRGDVPGAARARADLAAEPDPAQSQVATLWGIICDDVSWSHDVPQYQRDVLSDKRRFPVTNGMPSNVWPCTFWPTKPVEPVVRIGDRGPSNVLLLQNQRDPATPLLGAVAMRAALGYRARLVVADQGGHGAYLLTSNACISNAATGFLVNGTLPARDVYCPANSLQDNTNAALRDQAAADIHAKQFPF
jgi:pimeloyl-ACP methyl ester carboxylesterase